MSADATGNYLGRSVMSHKDVAKVMGLTKRGVQSIEERALKKLRKLMAERGFTIDDFKMGRDPGLYDRRQDLAIDPFVGTE